MSDLKREPEEKKPSDRETSEEKKPSTEEKKPSSEEKKPSEEEKKPSSSEEKKPSSSEEKKPSSSEEKKPSSEEKNPSSSEEKKPSSEEKNPSDLPGEPSEVIHKPEKRVCYIFQRSSKPYPEGHPVDRALQLTHNLVARYHLTSKLEVLRPNSASPEELSGFHGHDYVTFLSTAEDLPPGDEHSRFNIGGVRGWPIFDGLFASCQATAGGSLSAADFLTDSSSTVADEARIAVNWGGGFGESMPDRALGLGYVNDVALAVDRLRHFFARILCVSIGCSHPVGLERGFQDTRDVLTLSFHDNEEYCVNDAPYNLNLPLKAGIDDVNFIGLFEPFVEEIRRVYDPMAIVLQSRADALSGDPIGSFNLTPKGLAHCLRVLMSFNVPLLLLGGGGNNVLHAAKLWCYETAVVVGLDPEKMKVNDPEYSLVVQPRRVKNMNCSQYLQKLKDDVLGCVSRLNSANHHPKDLPVHIPDSKWSGASIHQKCKHEFTMADQILEAVWASNGLTMDDLYKFVASKRGRAELTRSLEGKVKDKANRLVSQGVLMTERGIFTIAGLVDDPNRVQDRKGKGVMKEGPGFNRGKKGKAKEALAMLAACGVVEFPRAI